MIIRITTDGPHFGKSYHVNTFQGAADHCKRNAFAAELVDEGEMIATVSADGTVRDLDQTIVFQLSA